jgi:F-type H+-transporting ATPase subunit a
VAAAEGKIDPMHQFMVEPLFGQHMVVGGYDISFTNSTLWMVLVLGLLWLFMMGGMKRELVPGRWQAAVEGVTGFISSMMDTNIGPEGKKFTPYVFSLFMFILFANLIGLVPIGIVPGLHAFTVTSHFTVTGVLAILSFSIVLIVGFWRHGFHFFSLFVPHGTPFVMALLIFPIELISFLVRPFSLGLRLFVAMIAGHILMDVFGNFIITGINGGIGYGLIVSLPSFLLILGISALELLVSAIQAYVFALLTSLYLNDAINLH